MQRFFPWIEASNSSFETKGISSVCSPWQEKQVSLSRAWTGGAVERMKMQKAKTGAKTIVQDLEFMTHPRGSLSRETQSWIAGTPH
jgi:hypothetical protein